LPKGRFATLSAWSYSVYTSYLNCPFQVCLEKIIRHRVQEEPKNEAMERGTRVHDAAEAFVGSIGRAPKLIPELQGQRDLLMRLRKANARTEQEWAFTREWTPTGWLDRDCWLRIKVDACTDAKTPPTVEIVDYKTGRVHPEHKQQRSLYALGGLQLVQIGQLAGGAKDVQLTAAHVYTDTTQTATEQYVMKDLPALKREWLTRIKTMMSDTQFRTKVGRHCRWCKFAKSKGGPCPENK